MEHLERALVDVDDADLLHAAFDELGVHLREDAEVVDAARAHVVDQSPDGAEVFDPQRYRRVLEQPARIALRLRQGVLSTAALGDVLDRDEHATPVALVAGQHRAV